MLIQRTWLQGGSVLLEPASGHLRYRGKRWSPILADLNDTENLLWRAFSHGTWVDLRTGDAAAGDLASATHWGPGRVVRAEVITALLLGAGELEPGYTPGVRLRGARVTGRLDFMGATLAYPLVCEYCYFDEELRFVEASTLSFFSRAEAMALHRSGCTRCGSNP